MVDTNDSTPSLSFGTALLEEAARFLRLLDPKAEKFSFQTFPDIKGAQTPRTFHGTLEEHAQALIDANRSGCGVSVAVNETNLQGRKIPNMRRVRALFQEDDGEGTTLPVEPHITVQSSPGKYHRYILVDGPHKFDVGSSVKLNAEFRAVQLRLVEDYGSDKDAKDLTRVLRVPGFYHMKNPKAPHLVVIVHATGDAPMAWGKAKEIFPPVEKKVVPLPSRLPLINWPRDLDYDAACVQEALKVLDPSDRGTWINAGMAIHATLGDQGLYLWDDWSRQSHKYHEGEPERKWSGFSADGALDIRALINMAKETGHYQAPPRLEDNLKMRGSTNASASAASDLFVNKDMPSFDVPSIFKNNRPQFIVLNQRTLGKEGDKEPTIFKPGVWFFGLRNSWKDGTKSTSDADPQWICSPLRILANTASTLGTNVGRQIELINWTTGQWEVCVLPMTHLVGRAERLWDELFSRGVVVDHNCKTHVMNYLHSHACRTTKTSVTQSGWVDETRIFALPDQSYGPAAETVVYEQSQLSANDYTLRGTLEGWQNSVAALSVGNPLAVFGISLAFSGPLLKRLKVEGGGGFHLYGGSSSGKTTVLRVACSVWGGPTYIRTWRATSNGLEGSALLFNDGFIALDEISQADGATVGDVAYFITNGEGKQRANIHGRVRGVSRWRLMALSTGERSLLAHMREGHKKAKVGQEIRITDIEANRAYGSFDELHGRAGGDVLADDLQQAAAAHHGHAGRAFLEQLTAYDGDLLDGLTKRLGTVAAYQDLQGGQEKRIARRFALVGMAGELATHFGLTGWKKGEATLAAATLFLGWRGERQRGDQEQYGMAEAMARFLEAHGESRFKNISPGQRDPVIRDMCGWVKTDDQVTLSPEGRVFYLSNSGMDAVLVTGHYDKKAMIAALKNNGALEIGSDGRNMPVKRFDGNQVKRVYVIHEDKLEQPDDSAGSAEKSTDSDVPF